MGGACPEKLPALASRVITWFDRGATAIRAIGKQRLVDRAAATADDQCPFGWPRLDHCNLKLTNNIYSIRIIVSVYDGSCVWEELSRRYARQGLTLHNVLAETCQSRRWQMQSGLRGPLCTRLRPTKHSSAAQCWRNPASITSSNLATC